MNSPPAPHCRMMKLSTLCLEQSFFGGPTKPILTFCSHGTSGSTPTQIHNNVTPTNQKASIAGYFTSMRYSVKPVGPALNPQLTELSSQHR